MTETTVRTIGGLLELAGVLLIAKELRGVGQHIEISKDRTLRRVIWSGVLARLRTSRRSIQTAWRRLTRPRLEERTGTASVSAGAATTAGIGTPIEHDEAMLITPVGGDQIAALRRDLLELGSKLADEVAARQKGDIETRAEAAKALGEAAAQFKERAERHEGRIYGLEEQVRSSLPLRWTGFVLLLLGVLATSWSAEIARWT